MSLSDLVSERKALLPDSPAPEVSPSSTQSEGAPEGNEGGPGAGEQPTGVATNLTPSGIEVYYQSGPKRLYRVRQMYPCDDPMVPSGGWLPDPDYPWQEVPSVSTVLGVLEKGGLSWWGMKVGVAGTLSVLRDDTDWALGLTNEIVDSFDGAVELFVEKLKQHKLTVNHVRDKAADRGTNVHSALESWVETGVIPDPQFFPENERGYVQGLVSFLRDANPEPIYSELMVGSAEYGFAGRFDLFGNLLGEVVVKSYPKRKPIRKTVDGSWLVDAKTKTQTDKPVKPYPSHKIQLGGYEGGLEESGYLAPDHKGLLHLFADGRYELVETHATYEDFLHVLDVYRALLRIEGK